MDSTIVDDSATSVMSRDSAKALGLKIYNSGKSCINEHPPIRYVANNQCIECRKMQKQTAKHYGPRCSIDGCRGPRDTNGLCPAHYQRWKTHGDPLAGGRQNGDGLRWIADHVSYKGDGCLTWPFGVSKNGKDGSRGYGLTYVDGEVIGAHVVMCRLVNGEKPEPHYQVAHSCGKGHEGCIHPDHLRWATPAENAEDRDEHGTTCRGEQSHFAKLTEDEVRQIRTLQAVVSTGMLAKMFSVDRHTITAIKFNRSWKHVD